MDSGVWIGAAAGLAGALVGAGGSIAATLVNQRYQRSESHREQRERLARETVDEISGELIALRGLAGTYPEEGAPESVMTPFRLAALKHHLRIEVALVRLPDRALAERMRDIVDASMLVFQGTEGSYRDRRQGAHSVTYEGLSCLGAFLRGDPLPPATDYTQAMTGRRQANGTGAGDP